MIVGYVTFLRPQKHWGQKACRNCNAALVFGPEPGCFLNSALRASIRICLVRPASSCWIAFYGKKCAMTVIGQWGGGCGGGGVTAASAEGSRRNTKLCSLRGLFLVSMQASLFPFSLLSPILFFVHLWLKNYFPGCCFLSFCFHFLHRSRAYIDFRQQAQWWVWFSYSLTPRRDELGEKLLSRRYRTDCWRSSLKLFKQFPPPFGVEFCHLWLFCIMAQKKVEKKLVGNHIKKERESWSSLLPKFGAWNGSL